MPETLRSIALTLRFIGTNYHGWQSQQNAKTVQDELERAVYKVTGAHVTVHGCGRTDAGVHASMYVASFSTASAIPAERIPAALNAWLSEDIAVYRAEEAGDSFHARFSCVKKEYVYKIYTDKQRNPFYFKRVCHYPYPLDTAEMNRAAAHLIGTHDFSVFRAANSTVKSSVRTIFDCHVEENDGLIEIYACADGFLYNMVRIIAGTLVYVARGKLCAEDIPGLLTAGKRPDAGLTMPPHGLYLNRLWYDDLQFDINGKG